MMTDKSNEVINKEKQSEQELVKTEETVGENSQDTNDSVKAEKVFSTKEMEKTEANDTTEEELVHSEEAEVVVEQETEKLIDKTISEVLEYFENLLSDLTDDSDMPSLSKIVEEIKVQFYKKHKAFIIEEQKKFVESGGKADDFKLLNNDDEDKFKDLYGKFKTYKRLYNERQQALRENNLKEKEAIIEAIKQLVHTEESLNKTYDVFKSLERKWRTIGKIPPQKVSDLWQRYHFAVEQFYDYIKINKELRDLDLKRNKEAKEALCEQAEALDYKKNPIQAFKILQQLHEEWKHIGPVAIEYKDSIWERFKEITRTINKAHADYFTALKEQEKKNLELKTALCEKAEAIASEDYSKIKEWNHKTEALKTLDTEWRKIGRVPKKYNSSIYQRFRDAFQTFFTKKKEYFKALREQEKKNLEIKTALCEKAEAVQDSTDIEGARKTLLYLQKQWKETGPVPHAESEKIWLRFRTACDTFFNRLGDLKKEAKEAEKDNLVKKQALLEKIEQWEPLADIKENISAINALIKEWDNIGFVPRKNVKEINTKYHQLIEQLYEKAKVDKMQVQLLLFEQMVKSKQQNTDFEQWKRNEISKLRKQLQDQEKEIFTRENSLSFFKAGKNAETLLKKYTDELEHLKERFATLKKKISILNRYSK